MAGRREVGFAVGVLIVGGVFLHSAHPKKNETGSAEGTNYFLPPSLAPRPASSFPKGH